MPTLGLEGGWEQEKNALVKLKMFPVVKAIIMDLDIIEEKAKTKIQCMPTFR